MTTTAPRSYHPREFRALTFHDATPRFRDGSDRLPAVTWGYTRREGG